MFKMEFKKLIVLIVVMSMFSFGAVFAQGGPPEDVGPDRAGQPGQPGRPDHARGNQNNDGTDNDADRPGRPDHAKEDRIGPPPHANVPEHVRNMIVNRVKHGMTGPPAFAGIPDFVRERIFGEKVADEVYAVTFAEENELEDVQIAVYEYVYDDEEGDLKGDQVGDTVTTDVYGEAEKELDNGEYILTATLDSYKDYKGDFEVDGEDKTVEFELEVDEEAEPAYFEINTVSFGNLTVEVGDEIKVSATISNSGDLEGEQDIIVTVDDWDVEEAEELSLEAGESGKVEFDIEVVEDAQSGEYKIKIETEDDSKSSEVTVK